MLKITKAYCINVGVNIKPIFMNKHVLFCASLELQRKAIICKENVYWKWDSKKSGL